MVRLGLRFKNSRLDLVRKTWQSVHLCTTKPIPWKQTYQLKLSYALSLAHNIMVVNTLKT